MSLINEMLRNLDARQSKTPGSDDGVVVTRESPRGSRNIVVYLLLATVAVLGAALFINEQGLFQDKPLAVVTSSSPTTEPAPAVRPTNNVQKPENPVPETEITAPMEEPAASVETPVLAAQSVAAPPPPAALGAAPAEPNQESGTAKPRTLVREILETPADHYAVQLVALSNEQKVLNFASQVGLDDPMHAPMMIGDRQAHVLLLGLYPSYVSAATARDDWMADKDTSINTWVRPIKALQKAIAEANPDEVVAATVQATRVAPLSNRDRQIKTLLDEAEEALIQERLTEPKGDNAYERYRQVLRLSANHPIAIAGIEQIVSKYIRLSNEYLDENNLERAQLLAERARHVDGASARVLQLEHRIKADGGATRVAERVAATAPEEQSIIQRTNRKTEEETLAEFNDLLARGALLPARNLLEQYLVSDPESTATVTALCRLYLQIGDVAMAGNLLDRTPNLPALTTLELSAQIQASQGDLAGAILMLEAVEPGFHETSYYSLRANLYQQTARYAEAARIYRRLLVDEPEHSAFWLGLAVCLDAMNSNEEALRAFRKTRDTGQYDGEVLNYVQERIIALSK